MTAEYLVSYGCSGEFTRFRPVPGRAYRRGDRVVIRTVQGIELGTVLCPMTAGHAPFLAQTVVGELLRPATDDDEQTARQARDRARRVFEDARRLAGELQLPLEILDVEILLDGQQAIIHHLRQSDCDYRPLVSTLSRQHDLLITMQNLSLPMEFTAEEPAGCGKPGCGQSAGGCSSCGDGGCATGGCSSGSCGKTFKKEDVAAYLASLHPAMDPRPRMPLL